MHNMEKSPRVENNDQELQVYIDGKFYPKSQARSPSMTTAFFMETAFSKESAYTTALSSN